MVRRGKRKNACLAVACALDSPILDRVNQTQGWVTKLRAKRLHHNFWHAQREQLEIINGNVNGLGLAICIDKVETGSSTVVCDLIGRKRAYFNRIHAATSQSSNGDLVVRASSGACA